MQAQDGAQRARAQAAQGAAARGRRHQSSSDLELQTTCARAVFLVRRWRRKGRILAASAVLVAFPILAKIACQDYASFLLIEGSMSENCVKILEELI